MNDLARDADWQRLKGLVADVLDQPPERRAQALREASAGDAQLESELASFVNAAQQPHGLLDGPPPLHLLGQPDTQAAPNWSGRTLGAYRLLSLIARGGMGEVYRAERADGQYEQQVAVKVMRDGADHAVLLARFSAERRILASLDHPNLAKLIDAGVTQEGVPFFVMELVDGQPIDAYCEEKRSSIEERLRLFRTVCQVVDYAHRKGVIHRDLKPGNILVTHDGVVKLVDFGIAKHWDPHAGETADRTATALQAMTPEYASPEQIRGEPATPASDIYALGVVLYRLLTGLSPYGDAVRDGYALGRAICESEPPAPSRVASDRAARRRLRGDLDAVVLMALRKAPARRHGSAEAFADDVFRHLEGLPVQARRGAWSYRAGRFVLRHRAVVAAALVANLALLTGVAVAAYQAYQANLQHERAERHFASVRQLAHVFIFDVDDAISMLPGSTPARQMVVDKALGYLRQLSAEPGGDPLLQVQLAAAYRKIGDIQGRPSSASLGDPPAAKASYEKAAALLEPLLDPRRSSQAARRAAQRERATVGHRQGLVLILLGELAAADAVLHRAAGIAAELAAADRSDQAIALLQGQIHSARSRALLYVNDHPGHSAESERATLLLRTIVERSPQDRDAALSLASHLGTRAEFLLTQRDAPIERAREALQVFRESLALSEPWQRRAPNDTRLARIVGTVHSQLGSALLRIGDAAAAARQFQGAVDRFAALTARAPNEAQFKSDGARAELGLARALLQQGDVAGSITRSEHGLAQFESLPPGARMEISVRYAQAAGHHGLALALEARARQPGQSRAAARADLQRACTHHRLALPVLQKIHRDVGLGDHPDDLHPDAVLRALRHCAG